MGEKQHVEGKYNYLADIALQESSPNLRKQYEEQYEKISSCLSSNQQYHRSRKSYEKCHKYRQYSPSCNTFNPRRETSIQFSPYQDKFDQRREKILIQELTEHNRILKIHLQESKEFNSKIQIQLTHKDTQIKTCKEKNLADLILYEKVVKEMKSEIEIILTKNKMQQNELHSLRLEIKENAFKNIMLKNDRSDKKASLHKKQERDVSEKTIQKPKRSVGKLLNKSLNNLQISSKSAKQQSKIRIEQSQEECEESNKLQESNTQEYQKYQQYHQCQENSFQNTMSFAPFNQNQNRLQSKDKNQELIRSIKQMYYKIYNHEVSSLKQIWKWLKNMAYQMSCLKKWKKRISKEIEIYPNFNAHRLNEVIKEGIGYLQ